MLNSNAQIVNTDFNGQYAWAPCNQRPDVRFVCGDATDVPFGDESLDAVTMFDLLENVPNDRQAVREVFRVLRPGGFLFVSTPNESWQLETAYAWIKLCIGQAPPVHKADLVLKGL